MDTGESRRALIVGIFISLGIVLFVLGIFTVGSGNKSFGGMPVNAVFTDVAGLKKGGGVWFSGVKVGTITDIQFTGPEQVTVKMTIDKSIQQYVHNDATAKIGSDGLIGNKIIDINSGSPQAPIIKEGDVLHAEKMLSTDDITKTLQENNVNILAITNDLKKVTKQMAEGKGMVGTLLTDSNLANKFRSIVQNLDNTTIATKNMSTEMQRFASKLNNKGTLADNLLNDTTTYTKLKAAASNLQATTAKASEFVNNLNTASGKLKSTDNTLGVLLNDPKGAEQIKSTLYYLQQSSVKLNDDLEALQHNFFTRGFFKDREKAKADSIKRAQKGN